MSGWNYRIMRQVQTNLTGGEDVVYGVHEAYYEGERVTSWTEEASAPFGETLDELSRDFAWMLTALVKPVLDYATGEELGPSPLLVDELNKMLSDGTLLPKQKRERSEA